MKLSIVLPTYKEKENLSVLVPQIESAFEGLSGEAGFEIIVVDDGSKDGTAELLGDFNKRFGNVRLIERGGLYGIGSALRDGYNAARGEFILSSDADLSFRPEDMKRLYEKIKEGCDLVLGYKIKYVPISEAGADGGVKDAWFKYAVSMLGNWTVLVLSRIKLKNFNTNFRILRREKWLKIKTNENNNFFNFETILKFSRNGFSIAEIPVMFYERRFGQSKLRFMKEAPKYFSKLIWYVFFDRSK